MADLRGMIEAGVREKFPNKYVKQWLNAEHTAAQIIECYPDGRQRRVSDDQDVYLRWLAAGNVPAEIEYVAPPPPPPDTRTEEEKAADAWARERDLGREVYGLLQRVDALERGEPTR